MDSSNTSVPRRDRALLLAFMLLSMAARVIMLQGNLWRLGEDVDDYLRLAENVAIWGTFGSFDRPTAYRPPLYPIVLAPVYWLQSILGAPWGWRVTAIGLIHVACGIAMTIVTYRTAERWGLGRWSLLAAALVAVDPVLLHYARLPMTETLSAFLFAACLYALTISDRRTESFMAYVAGFVLGLGMLCRTTFWAYTIAVILAGAVRRRDDGSRNWYWGCIVLAVALVVQLPWWLRNWRALGKPVLTTTHGGYTLLLGNNESYYDQVIRSSPLSAWSHDGLHRWQMETNVRAALDGVRTEVERDKYLYEQAWKTMTSRPRDFAVSVFVRFLSFWRVVPHAGDEYGTTVRLAVALFYVPVLLCMVLGLARGETWQWPLVTMPVALISFTAVHLVYWSDMRMRATIVPAIAILAALGAGRVCAFVRGAKDPRVGN